MSVGDGVTDDEIVRRQLIEFARDMRDLYRTERQRSRDLERALRRLEDSYLATMESLARLVEAKDETTRHHLDRTADLAVELTRRVDPELAGRAEISHGFRLHDIGKVAIAERILTKRGSLSASEWAEMRTHPEVGADIVAPLGFLGDAVDVIRYHHERFDGRGYPHRLAGEEIPLAARIFAVVDAFDAMTNDRPYRKARPAGGALEEIERRAGTQFDPRVVAEFLALIAASPAVLEAASSDPIATG